MAAKAKERFILFCLVVAAAAPAAADVPGESKVAREGQNQVSQLVTPGFESLPLRRRAFVYWLTQAMEAGRDIAWKQLSRNGLEIRGLMEALWEKNAALNADEKDAIKAYFFRLLVNHSNYDRKANRKFLLEGFSPSSFAATLARAGVRVDKSRLIELDLELFDPDYRATRIEPANGSGDSVAGSATNFYGPGVTAADVARLGEAGQSLLAYVYRAGRRGEIGLGRARIGGRFGPELERVSYFLDQAKPYAAPEEVAIIEALQKSYRTGDPEDMLRAERLWTTYQSPDVTFMIGFVETYDDPLGARGTWESFVFLREADPASVARARAIRAAAPFYEAAMPVDARFKKQGEFTPPGSETGMLAYMVGSYSEAFFLGKNLPNDAKIRETLGSKSMTNLNVVNDLSSDAAAEFDPSSLAIFYSPAYHALLRRTGRSRQYVLQVEFHEILGHGSGRELPGVDARKALGGNYSALEEARAETAALYHMADPGSLIRLGILPAVTTPAQARETAMSAIIQFFTGHLGSYQSLVGRPAIQQAHQLARQIMFNDLVDSGALRIEFAEPAGPPLVRLTSLQAARSQLGLLWSRVQKIKSTGNSGDLQKLIDNEGRLAPEHQRWASLIADAKRRANSPKEVLYLQPKVHATFAADGRVTDVRFEYEPRRDTIEVALDRNARRKIEAAAIEDGYRRAQGASRACRAF